MSSPSGAQYYDVTQVIRFSTSHLNVTQITNCVKGHMVIIFLSHLLSTLADGVQCTHLLFHMLTGLSYCRHLKTVRTHLSGLVNSELPVSEPHGAASKGLTADVWQSVMNGGEVCIFTLSPSIFKVPLRFFRYISNEWLSCSE